VSGAVVWSVVNSPLRSPFTASRTGVVASVPLQIDGPELPEFAGVIVNM